MAYRAIPAARVGSRVIDVKTKGAVGDARLALDGSTTNASNLITSATAGWTPADVGKRIWVTWPAVGAAVLLPTTITSYVSATQVRTAINATASATACHIVWGTRDDTAAFQAAFADAIEGTSTTINAAPPGTIYAPPGGYMISERIYANLGTTAQTAGPSLIGAGKTATSFYVAPNFTVPASGGMVISNFGYGATFSDFCILGGYVLFAIGANRDVMTMQSAVSFSVERVTINWFGSTTALSAAFGVTGSIGDIRQLTVQNGGISGSQMIAGHWRSGAGVVQDTVLSNFPVNLRVSGNNGRSPVGSPLLFAGCVMDETSALIPSQIVSGGNLNAVACTFFGSPDSSIYIDGTSKLWIDKSNVGRFQNYNLGGGSLVIDSGGVVYAGGTTFRGNAVAPDKYIENAGTFRNLGGNDYLRYSAADTFTVETPADCFDGNAPVDE